jgi:hypothetical protein
LHHPSLGQRTAAQSCQNDALPWSEIFEDTEDLDLELLYPVPRKDSPPGAAQPGVNIPEREQGPASHLDYANCDPNCIFEYPSKLFLLDGVFEPPNTLASTSHTSHSSAFGPVLACFEESWL